MSSENNSYYLYRFIRLDKIKIFKNVKKGFGKLPNFIIISKNFENQYYEICKINNLNYLKICYYDNNIEESPKVFYKL